VNSEKQTGLVEHFAELPDPRQRQNREHKFIDILVITICAAICGADEWVAVEQFGCGKQSWCASFLELPSGIPTHDTSLGVFRHLDAEQFQACFIEWIASVQELTAGEVIAVDGKQLRRWHDAPAGKAAIHRVSAWATTNSLVLRHMALTLLKQDDTLKVGIKNKRLRAGWDQDYLLTVLSPLLTLQ
jgi:hypothetical protein